LIAAVLVVLLTDGPRGLLTPGSRLGCWRASWVWYALALGVPPFAHFAAASITSRAGRISRPQGDTPRLRRP
jgi:hypothetical protein